jgi:hypothetical protein
MKRMIQTIQESQGRQDGQDVVVERPNAGAPCSGRFGKVVRGTTGSSPRPRVPSEGWPSRPACSSGPQRSSSDALRDGIALRKFGQQVIERLAKERIHPSWTVPGGVNAPLDPHAHEKTLAELPAAQAIVRRTIELWKRTLERHLPRARSPG